MSNRIIMLIVWIILNCIPALFVTVAVHELGHLTAGKMSGYRPVYLKILFLAFYRKGQERSVRIEKGSCFGQCIMIPELRHGAEYEKESNNPEKLVLGGCLFNLSAALLFCFLHFIIPTEGIQGDFFRLFFLETSILNLIICSYNLFGASETSDGSTFRELIKRRENVEAYNSLMLVYAGLLNGDRLDEMDDSLFWACSVSSSLLAELTLMSCKREAMKQKPGIISDRLYERFKIIADCDYDFAAGEARYYLEKYGEGQVNG